MFRFVWLMNRTDFMQAESGDEKQHSAGDLINLLQGLLSYDPASRLTAQEALEHPFLTERSERRR
jgi:serine/threonine protein kinase